MMSDHDEHTAAAIEGLRERTRRVLTRLMSDEPGVVIFLTARTAHDLQHLCGQVQIERTRDDGRHPYPSVSDASLKEIREKLSEAWRAQ